MDEGLGRLSLSSKDFFALKKEYIKDVWMACKTWSCQKGIFMTNRVHYHLDFNK